MREKMLNIIEKFNLITEEIEPSVFKVINTDKEIDIHRFKQELGTDIAFISSCTLKTHRIGDIIEELENIYYIMPKRDDIMYKYEDKAAAEQPEVTIDYMLPAIDLPSIDTLYTPEELGV